MGGLDGTGRCLSEIVVEEGGSVLTRRLVVVCRYWRECRVRCRWHPLGRLHDADAVAGLWYDDFGADEGDVR